MPSLGGYVGRILNIDLSHSKIQDEELSEDLLRSFVGGYGLGARLLYERMPAGADPLGPQNILGLVTGPLTGTRALIGSRYCAVAKSPLTGGWGDASAGGAFGPTLKFAGYDAVFATGVSQQPVYLLIDEGEATFRPAEDLWGLDTAATEECLQQRHGTDVRVACIGQAGECQALISCIISDRGRAAGRSGLGAVMGSKRLKAVAVRGGTRPPERDPDRVRELRSEYLPNLREEDTDVEICRRYGTPGYTKALLEVGRTPIRNWKGTYPQDFPHADAVDGPAVVAYETRKYTCWGCPIACGGIVRWEWEGQEFVGHKPEYESLAALGTYLGISDLDAIMTLEEMCNQAGYDTISAGATIGFATECYEHDLLTEDELDGLTLQWGDGESAIELLQRMIERRGLGDLLADGVLQASHRIGRDSDAFAMHAGGQELPAHDPRHEEEFGLVYQMSPTPGRHTQGGVGAAAMAPERKAIYGLDPSETEPSAQSRAHAYATVTAWKNVLNAAGLCGRGNVIMGPEHVPNFVAAVTGWEFDMAECLEAGERIEVIRHLFGLREGHSPLDTKVAARAMGNPPQRSGPIAGASVDVADLRAAYVQRMDWDPDTGAPSVARLEALGLSDLVAGEPEPVQRD